MRREVLILAILVLMAIVVNYPFIDSFLSGSFQNPDILRVTRVIDGDTAIIGNQSVRFLGINASETTTKEFYSEEAKNFLKQEIENKTVTLVFTGDRTDKYGRTLAYALLNNENENVKMVENGYAYYYFYSGEDLYSQDLRNAWDDCLNKQVNLCAPSEEACGQCVKIENSRKIINDCSTSCSIANWMIKGEGREEFHFNQTSDTDFGPGAELSFNISLADSGRSLYLRDDQGHLVDWGVF